MKSKTALTALLALLSLAPAWSQEAKTAPAPSAPEAAAESPAHKYFGDVKLVNQDGQEVRLYTDLMQGKTVIINAMFATCTGACPTMSGTMAKIQDHLGDRVGKDVRLISITVDPVNDTPAKLKEYANRFHAKPGWQLLTGSKENVEAALRKLGQWTEDPSNHQTLFLIGNDRTGLWKKAFALAKPEEVLTVVDSVANDKGEG
jgi:protein SCO1/2